MFQEKPKTMHVFFFLFSFLGFFFGGGGVGGLKRRFMGFEKVENTENYNF